MAFSREQIISAVRERYAGFAKEQASGSGCCGSTKGATATSKALGYSEEELAAVPEGANLGLGCGNPAAIASLKRGETVLDLGAGGGFDCFLAARAVGETGRVIGVDMTPDMVTLARANARKAGNAVVDFRLGEIEHLPVPDGTVDVIISNCVINLSADKPQVFREAFRVLKRGGRLAVSDMVSSSELPQEVREDLSAYSACVCGAVSVEALEGMLRDAGFASIDIRPKQESKEFIKDWSPDLPLEDYVLSAFIQAVKP